MKKSKIIIGQSGSGKTKLASELAQKYDLEDVTYVNGRTIPLNDHFLFEDCEPFTKLVVIDDIPGPLIIDDIIALQSAEGFMIPKKHHKQFMIKPELIFVMDEKTKLSDLPTEQSFRRRFDIIHCVGAEESSPPITFPQHGLKQAMERHAELYYEHLKGLTFMEDLNEEVCELDEWNGGDETNLCDCGKGEGLCKRKKTK